MFADLKSGVKLRAGHQVVLIVGDGHGRRRHGQADSKDVHVLAVQLHAIGNSPMAHETVLVIDPDSGEQVGDPITADEQGRIRAIVPQNKEYHLRLVDEPGPPLLQEDGHSRPPNLCILARFSDRAGHPLANEKVHLAHAEGEADLITDEQGELHIPASPGIYLLEARGEKFRAHPILAGDQGGGEFRFVVDTKA
jgi:hypothetical protein